MARDGLRLKPFSDRGVDLIQFRHEVVGRTLKQTIIYVDVSKIKLSNKLTISGPVASEMVARLDSGQVAYVKALQKSLISLFTPWIQIKKGHKYLYSTRDITTEAISILTIDEVVAIQNKSLKWNKEILLFCMKDNIEWISGECCQDNDK